MSDLRAKVRKLIPDNAVNLKLRSVRSLIRRNRAELGHIKTTGKGRNKSAIAKDLEQWLEGIVPEESIDDDVSESEEEIDFILKHGHSVDAIVLFNDLAVGGVMGEYMDKEHRLLGKQITAEYEANGDFKSWDDVEDRVKGFKRTLITERYPCSFEFSPFIPCSLRCGLISKRVIPLEDQPEMKDASESEQEESTFVPEQGVGHIYIFNCIANCGLVGTFMDKEHHLLSKQITAEYNASGDFKGWDDVEDRVNGFKRTLITERNTCCFEFSPRIEGGVRGDSHRARNEAGNGRC